MENKQLKNMIILKNLPSNMIEEAIVILKENKKVQLPKHTETNKEHLECKQNSNEYILREAEFVISNYVSNIEKNKKVKNNKSMEMKYKKARAFSIMLLILIILQAIIF